MEQDLGAAEAQRGPPALPAICRASESDHGGHQGIRGHEAPGPAAEFKISAVTKKSAQITTMCVVIYMVRAFKKYKKLNF